MRFGSEDNVVVEFVEKEGAWRARLLGHNRLYPTTSDST